MTQASKAGQSMLESLWSLLSLVQWASEWLRSADDGSEKDARAY
jgi:hypothetical protein